MNYIKTLFFFDCIFILFFSLFIIKAINNYFYITKQESISFVDLNEYEQEWYSTQPKIIRHDFNVNSLDDIPKLMESLNIDGITISSTIPSYNAYNKKELYYHLKNPQNNLLGIYFKPKNNPFNKEYPINDYKYTLEDLLKCDIAISEAYIFWKNENQQNQNITKKIFYHSDGKTISYIQEHDNTGKIIQATIYQYDGKTILYILKYNEKEEIIKAIFYHPNGTIASIKEYNN